MSSVPSAIPASSPSGPSSSDSTSREVGRQVMTTGAPARGGGGGCGQRVAPWAAANVVGLGGGAVPDRECVVGGDVSRHGGPDGPEPEEGDLHGRNVRLARIAGGSGGYLSSHDGHHAAHRRDALACTARAPSIPRSRESRGSSPRRRGDRQGGPRARRSRWTSAPCRRRRARGLHASRGRHRTPPRSRCSAPDDVTPLHARRAQRATAA